MVHASGVRSACFFLGATAALLLAGCAEQAAPAFVGMVEGSDAVVGAVSENGKVTFYLCGGKTTYATLTRWFSGDVADDGSFSLESKGFTLTGNLTKGSGTITTPSETLDWTAAPATGDMGLYSTLYGSCRTGAVVGDMHGDGMELQGVWCDGDRFAQVTPIRGITVNNQGIEVEADVPPTPIVLTLEKCTSP